MRQVKKVKVENLKNRFHVWIGDGSVKSINRWLQVLYSQEYVTSVEKYGLTDLPLIVKLDPRFEGNFKKELQELYDANGDD
tara:strand:+ start:720 stop:962 length:243 start_codon:yes stop_codon:yes gene_type:complete